MDEVQQDRLAALRAGGADGVARLFARVPCLAEAAAGVGVVSRYGHGYFRPRSERITSLRALAVLLEGEHVIDLTIGHATLNEQKLLMVAAFHGGLLTREQAAAVVGDVPESVWATLDSAAEGLGELLLSDPTLGWVSLRPGVIAQIALPGVTVREGLQHVTSDAIANMLRHLGVANVGNRRDQRLDALEAALRDRAFIEGVVAGLPDRERRVFVELVRYGTQRVSAFDIGYFAQVSSYDRMMDRSPLHRLHGMGLIGVDVYEQVVWAWLDAIVALSGAMFDDWAEATRTPIPISGEVASAPRAVSRLDQLLDRWRVAPPKALKTGGIGVAPIRTLAKSMGIAPAEIGLLSALAIELDLLGLTKRSESGRGRNRVIEFEWRPTAEADGWRRSGVATRWARLVQQWRDSTQLEVGGPIERFEPGIHLVNRHIARDLFLRALLAAPPGTGFRVDELIASLAAEYAGIFGDGDVAQLVDEARALGLIAASGTVGLTETGRALVVDGVGAVAARFEGNATTFLVQGDHTVIAPPDLAADVRVGLEQLAELESDAGAFVYRITDAAVIRALDHGADADALLEFVFAHSSVPVPPNVERTVRDAAARHGRIVVGAAVTYITADDPALLASAVAVKAAQLIAVSPTTAVSALAEGKVLAALRSKQLAPVSATGVVVDEAVARDADTQRNRVLEAPAPFRDRLMIDSDTMNAMAKHLADTIVPTKRPARA